MKNTLMSLVLFLTSFVYLPSLSANDWQHADSDYGYSDEDGDDIDDGDDENNDHEDDGDSSHIYGGSDSNTDYDVFRRTPSNTTDEYDVYRRGSSTDEDDEDEDY